MTLDAVSAFITPPLPLTAVPASLIPAAGSPLASIWEMTTGVGGGAIVVARVAVEPDVAGVSLVDQPSGPRVSGH